MTGIVDVLVQNILPIFLVAGVGFWLRRSKGLDKRVLSGVVFNAFSPALVFSSLVNSQLPAGELGRLVLFAVAVMALMGLVGLITGRVLGLSRPDVAVLLLTVIFVNGGNYGLTLNQLRYGNDGLARAVVYYVTSTILIYSAGVFIVSMGRQSWRASLRRLATVPAIYATVLAIVVYSLQIKLPQPILSAIDVAGAGAIPAMLVVLGMNMADLRGLKSLHLATPAVTLRLLLGPLVAVLVAGWLGLQGISRSTSVIEASMPTAVFTTVLATEFDVQPAVVTGIVVVSTLLSPVTLALAINLFGL